MIANGDEGRRLYLDAIEAAMRTPGRKGAALPRNTAEDALMRQVAQCEKVRRQFDRFCNKARRANHDWVPDSELVTAIAKNTDALAKALSTLERMRKSAKDAMRGLTEEQLDKVFLHQLRRHAQRMTTEQWRELLSIGFGTDVAEVVLRGRE